MEHNVFPCILFRCLFLYTLLYILYIVDYSCCLCIILFVILFNDINLLLASFPRCIEVYVLKWILNMF